MQSIMTKQTDNPRPKQPDATPVNWNEPVTRGQFETTMTAFQADFEGQTASLRRDMIAMRADLEKQIADLRTDMVELRADLERQIAALDSRITEVEMRLGQRISGVELRLDRRISDLESRMIRWQIITMVTLTGVIVAAAGYLSNAPM